MFFYLTFGAMNNKIKIGTINFDWCRKSKSTIEKVNEILNSQNFDFLIVTENIEDYEFNASHYYAYHTSPIPTQNDFEYMDYGKYLKGEIPVRTTIYTPYNSTQKYEVIDPKTSIALGFQVKGLDFILYGSIIGTWGLKYQIELAQKELDNFREDIEYLKTINENIIIAGDLNASFIEAETSSQLTQIQSRNELRDFTNKESLEITTSHILNNIDHILVSKSILSRYSITPSVFMDSETLKDPYHKGIQIELQASS